MTVASSLPHLASSWLGGRKPIQMSSILDPGMANKNSIHNISENFIQLATHNYKGDWVRQSMSSCMCACMQCYYYKGSRFWQMSIRILHNDHLLNPIDDFSVYWGGQFLKHLLPLIFLISLKCYLLLVSWFWTQGLLCLFKDTLFALSCNEGVFFRVLCWASSVVTWHTFAWLS